MFLSLKVGIEIAEKRGDRRAARVAGFDPEGGEGHSMNRTLSDDVHYSNGELGISQCVWCRHRSEGGRQCRAYPKGIPEAIATNRHDHRQPFDGDYGVRFEPDVIEIEFVGVESEPESIALTAELAVAMARVGSTETADEDHDVVFLEAAEFENDGDVFDLGERASG